MTMEPSDPGLPASGTPAPPAPPAWQPPQEPTGPAPGVHYADHGKRLVAYILDVIIIGIVTAVVAIVFAIVAGLFLAGGANALAGISIAALVIIVFVISLGYFPYFWVKSGQTPGLRAMGLKVVMDKDGASLTWGPAILRLFGYWVDGLVFYLGFIWILIDSRRRGWHDLIAGTIVIQRD